MSEKNLTVQITEAMEAYELPLLKYVTGILKDPEQAKDIVQDAFIKYLRYLNADKPEISNVRAWLYRVSHNLSLDYIRKNKRKVDGFEEIQVVVHDESVRSPDEALAAKDAYKILWAGVDELDDREKQIVHLKIKEDKSYKEIASLMDLTTSNVGFILHRTMKKLGKFFKEKSVSGL